MKINNQVKVTPKSNYYYLTVPTREGEWKLKLRQGWNKIKPQGRWERAEYLRITTAALIHYYKHPVVKRYWVEPEIYYWREDKVSGEKYLVLDPAGKLLSWLEMAKPKPTR